MPGESKDFYLGKAYDLENGKILEKPIHYDPSDLTTHAVITGMTGSGKTGLGMILLEEAALQGIPAILIDPKGDLTNLLLHFPELRPEDFQPWVDRDAARRSGKTLEKAAEETAALWKKGLADWGIGEERLRALSEVVNYAIYTPGSDAGLPVSILASLSAPDIPWEGNKEILRDKISGTVTALLGLIGLDNIDPMQAREHILLSNIFETAWREGKDLDMASLITQVQSPPFEKLGVFSVAKFFPEKDRQGLALRLNNFLAAPAFQSWLEGQALDVAQLLYTSSGRPRHSVFYLAHLNDEERMFFVTLLYSAIESWMRTQKGASQLRALVYFDEIVGYLPPVSNPPSKSVMLRLLKQARAFGVGLVVATQNPVDLDYKALSNAGTWMVGKLQTEQDKARLLDGLEGAAPGIERRMFDRMISLLDKRIFLLHNVHEDEPRVFHTRWAMNYLAGPLTRVQIPEVNALADVESEQLIHKQKTEALTPSEDRESLGTDVPPAVPSSVDVYYLPADRGPSEAVKETGRSLDGEVGKPRYYYQPTLAAQARVVFVSKKHNITHETLISVRLNELKRQGLISWDKSLVTPFDLEILNGGPLPEPAYAPLAMPLDDASLMRDLKKDFEEWIYRSQRMTIRVHEDLGVVAGPDVSEEAFHQQCLKAAEEARAEDLEAVKAKFEKKFDSLENKLYREEQDLEEDKQELNHRRMEELGTGVENVLSLFVGRKRRMTTSLTKRRMTAKAKADLAESEQEIIRLQKELKELQETLREELELASGKWDDVMDDIILEQVSPYKKDIFVELFGLMWLPYYAFQQGQGWVMAPAFDSDGE